MKLKIFYFLLVLFIVGCSGGNGCRDDSECVPVYGCHPHECVQASDFQEGPDGDVLMCTKMFDTTAAYTAEDCLCEDGACVNKNLNNR